MSASRSLSWALFFASSGVLLLGCDDPLKNASLIEETRPLGARVEVANDAKRGSPAPGEHAKISLFLAAPNGAPSVAFALSVCGVSPTNFGFPSCKSAPFASAFRAEPAPGAPELEFDVPAELDLAATPHGFLSGSVCPDDTAMLTAAGDAQCAHGPGEALAFEFAFAGVGEDNQNPTFAADSLTLDGEPWDAASGATCPGSPTDVHARSRHVFGLRMQDGDFDPLPQTSAESPARETLLVSQFASAGKLAHTFSSIAPDTNGLSSLVNWDAPANADENGALVHVYFVVRDGRGGEALATRALCLVP